MNQKEIDRLTLHFVKKRDKSLLDSVMTHITQISPPSRYLEIGVFRGGTIRTILEESKPHPKLITLIDNFSEIYDTECYDNFSHIHQICDEVEFENNREFFQENSHSVLPRLVKSKRLYDLILVDGDHSYLGQWLDIAQSWQLLDKSGLMVIDDVYNKTLPWVGHAVFEFYKLVRKMKECVLIESINVPPEPGCVVLMRI